MRVINFLGRKVKILPGYTRAYFTAGDNGKHERGWYYFWTAICVDKNSPTGFIGITGRSRKKTQTDRFSRFFIEKNPADIPHIKTLKTITHIRKSYAVDLSYWFLDHLSDAKYLKKVEIV